MKQAIAHTTFRFTNGEAAACALAFIATAVAVVPAIAQAPERFTVNRVVKYAPGTDKVRAQLGAIPAARAIVAGDFGIAAEDLDDDGRKEIILRPRLPQCRQVPCSLLVLRQTPTGAETLFDRPVPPSDLAVTNERVGGFRALVAVDSKEQILTRGRTPTEGLQVYAMRDARPPPATVHSAPTKVPADARPPQATVDAAPTKVPAATPVRGGLVGRSISDQQGIVEAFQQAVECSGSPTSGARHEGSLRGRRFQFISVSCQFEGGNAEWGALLVAFHDGQKVTQAIAFPGSLHVGSFIGPKNDRIVYEAIVTRPEDARCCPSGKAIVEIDVDRQLATAKAVGFTTRYDPMRGKALK